MPVRQAFRWFSFALMGLLILLPSVQIVLRSASLPLIGAEELARVLLIMTVYVSLPQLVYAGASIRLDELIGMLPRHVLRVVHAMIAIVSAVVFAVIAVCVWAALQTNLETATPTLELPYWMFLSAALAGCVFAAIEFAVVFFRIGFGLPPYFVFADEQPPEDALAL